MTAQLSLLPSTIQPTGCPYCGHRQAVHAGPGAPSPDVQPGDCGELCGCPGWHPLREPEACHRCDDASVELFYLEGFSAWFCGGCLLGHWGLDPRRQGNGLLAYCP